MQDAQNLCWKLAAVLRGQADAALLDSYHAERQPLATMITEAALLNATSMGRETRQEGAVLPRREFLNEQGLIFGATYRSAAIVPDDTDPPAPADPVTEYLPSATPGRRAPHVPLTRGGAAISTIDLFGRGFVLLAGSAGGAWVEAAARIAAPTRPGVVAHHIGGDLVDAGGSFHAAYEIGPAGAVAGAAGWPCRLAQRRRRGGCGGHAGGGDGPHPRPRGVRHPVSTPEGTSEQAEFPALIGWLHGSHAAGTVSDGLGAAFSFDNRFFVACGARFCRVGQTPPLVLNRPERSDAAPSTNPPGPNWLRGCL